MTRPKTIFLLSLAALIASNAIAQTDADLMKPAEMESIQLSDFPSMVTPRDLGFFLFTPNIIEEDVFILHDGDYKRLQPALQGLSQKHFYKGPAAMRFYRKGVDEEGGPLFIDIGGCNLKPTFLDVIIVLNRSGGDYTGTAIDLSLDSQELGTVRFVNLTPANLVVLLNDARRGVKPGQEVIAEVDTGMATFFPFKVAAMYENEPKVIFSNRYPFRGAMRRLFIGYPSPLQVQDDVPFQVIDYYDRGPDSRPHSLN